MPSEIDRTILCMSCHLKAVLTRVAFSLDNSPFKMPASEIRVVVFHLPRVLVMLLGAQGSNSFALG